MKGKQSHGKGSDPSTHYKSAWRDIRAPAKFQFYRLQGSRQAQQITLGPGSFSNLNTETTPKFHEASLKSSLQKKKRMATGTKT